MESPSERALFPNEISYENSTIITSKSGGTALFPVLPSSNVSIHIFLTPSSPVVPTGPTDALVSIIYYY